MTNEPEKKKQISKEAAKMRIDESAREARSDVLGSYTGVPQIDDEHPVQDADDL